MRRAWDVVVGARVAFYDDHAEVSDTVSAGFVTEPVAVLRLTAEDEMVVAAD